MTDIKINGKVVGVMDEGSYTTKRNRKKHLMRIYDAWGFSEYVVDTLIDMCINNIIVECSDGLIYKTTLLTLLDKGIKKEWGGDTQFFLPLKCWDVKQKGQEVLFQ